MTPETDHVPRMEYTDERMIPEWSNASTFWEHICRYRFAARFVRNKSVLDIACGEGYGTAALAAAGASKVAGVDISAEACQHAKKRYNVDAIQGNCEQIPFPDNSFEIVVSFETIEHVSDPERFVAQVSRVLTHSGKLIVSTPNLTVYKDVAVSNPYHCSEMSATDFHALLKKYFPSVKLYSQRPLYAPWWSLRGFAAMRSVWSLWGFRRMRAIIYRCFGRKNSDTLDETTRQDVVNLIANIETRRRDSIFDPFAVVPIRMIMPDEPLFIVAVASK